MCLIFQRGSWGQAGWLWWQTHHGSNWRASLCLISLLQWPGDCWAQRLALCLSPRVALNSIRSVLQKGPLGFLRNIIFMELTLLRSPIIFALTYRKQLSDGADSHIWAKKHFRSMLCCSLRTEQGIPPSLAQVSFEGPRGPAPGGERKWASCYRRTEDLSVWHCWTDQIQIAATLWH